MTRIFDSIRSPAVFGATGSLGGCVCRVLVQEGIRCSHLAGFRGHDRLARLLPATGASTVSFAGDPSPALAGEMARLDVRRVISDVEGLEHAGSAVIVSSGLGGFECLCESIRMGIPVAIGNKETVVAWGRLARGPLAKAAGGCDLRPVDSEHAAAAVLLRKAGGRGVRRLILTGTGGAVRDVPGDRRFDLPPQRVLEHPVWRMGSKITVDSATLMNKAFEIIEASVMFDLPGSAISVLIEPDATIHAALETSDGRTLAFAGPADMETPVRIACGLDFCGTSRVIDGSDARDAVAAMSLPDHWAMRAISLGYAALDAGGTSPMVLAIADEAAVNAYLAGELRFGDIVPFIESAFDRLRWARDMDPESERDLRETLARASASI